MTLHEQIREAVLKTGFTACGAVPRTSLVFHPEIRALCEGNACRSYHTSWACPPAVGTLDECRARVEQRGMASSFPSLPRRPECSITAARTR